MKNLVSHLLNVILNQSTDLMWGLQFHALNLSNTLKQALLIQVKGFIIYLEFWLV
jgi:hypothetical protein